jgi:hypothetical protein
VSASNFQRVLSRTDQHLDIAYAAPSRLSVADPSVDDPVNGTGISSQRGDLQLSDEFACLVKVICEQSGEFS